MTPLMIQFIYRERENEVIEIEKKKKKDNMENESLFQEKVTVDEQLLVVDDEFIFNDDLDRADECIKMLAEREICFNCKYIKDQSLSVFDNWIKFARLEAITWILKSRAIFGFQFQTVYLAIVYFDQFLSRRSIDRDKSWAVKLLSVACLSLAAKMEEIKVPPLSDFQIEDYNFQSKSIQRMELLVLDTLEWKMMFVTPFCFVHHFIIKLTIDSQSLKHFVSTKIIGLIWSLIKEIDLTKYKPSVIAAAATLMAYDRNLTRKILECKLNSMTPAGFLELEDVFQCYSLMQNLEMGNIRTQTIVNSQDLQPNKFSPMNVLENSSVTSAVGIERKRLAFKDSDKQFELPDQPHHNY